MRDVMTTAGVLLILGTVAWYGASRLLRAVASGWLVFAGVGLLRAGQGAQSPWAPVAFAALGAGSWAAPARAAPRAPRNVGHLPRCRREPPAPPSEATHGRAQPR